LAAVSTRGADPGDQVSRVAQGESAIRALPPAQSILHAEAWRADSPVMLRSRINHSACMLRLIRRIGYEK
jgi:hypothetical protein